MNEKLLKSYVRSMLLEMSYEDIKTSKDPLDWVEAAFQEPEEWNTKDPFRAMIRAAKKFGLEEFGMGSSRFVFNLKNGKVLKIARNSKGLEQNKLEAVAGRDPHVHSILASVYDASPEYAWLVAEFVNPLEDGEYKTAERVCGVAWSDVRRVLGLSNKAEVESTVSQVTKKLEPEESRNSKAKGRTGSGCPTGKEFLESLGSFLGRYSGMLTGDIEKLSSWGVNDKGCLVLLDYGITRKKFEELYK